MSSKTVLKVPRAGKEFDGEPHKAHDCIREREEEEEKEKESDGRVQA